MPKIRVGSQEYSSLHFVSNDGVAIGYKRRRNGSEGQPVSTVIITDGRKVKNLSMIADGFGYREGFQIQALNNNGQILATGRKRQGGRLDTFVLIPID